MADPTSVSGSPLGDLFAGAAGANINRPALNAFVANSQAINGLRSAQTQDALIKAQQAQEETEAHGRLFDDLTQSGLKPSDAMLTRDMLISHFGDAQTALKAVGTLKLGYGSPAEQTSGQQMVQGKEAGPVTTPPNFQMPPGSPLSGVPVQQSPTGAAQTNAANALAGLNTAKATNPAAFRAQAFGATSPEGQAALTQAVQEGRLDPTRVNSRTAPILAQMELNTPGMNFNRLHADAALQANNTFQQRAMSVDMMPGLLSNVTALGKKLNNGSGYNDLRTVGQMQQWANGETNDPDYTEYMTARNDTLLRLASVMRGVGMSDQAHTAEVQAMAPTLAPYALDAWLKGQMSVVQPLLDRQNRITHLGEPGQGTQRLGTSTPSTSQSSGPPPLGSQVPTPSGAPASPAASAGLPSYPDEATALAAGHRVGDHVMVGGVSGTLQ